MRKRLIICLGGAALGAYVGSTIYESLGFAAADAMAVCSLAGMAVGYVASTLLEVFTAKPDSLIIPSDAD